MMKLKEARRRAEWLVRLFKPECEKIVIAGSIRRQVDIVKDIELVAQPKRIAIRDLLNYEHVSYSPFNKQITLLLAEGAKIEKMGDRYVKIRLADGIAVDLFRVIPPAQWGVILAIRTGPARYSKSLVTQRMYNGKLPNDAHVKDGVLWRDGQKIETPEELDFYQAIGLPWPDPRHRR
jgi:DNA polymerase/3'-5' exonuclease PolX